MARNPAEIQINLSESGEKTDTKPAQQANELTDRDPKNTNAHLKVSFEEIFAEPHKSIHSFNIVWTTSQTVFIFTRLWCYRIISLVFALPAALIWGVHFALLSCCTIWCCRPCIRSWSIEMHCLRSVLTFITDAFIKPCFTAAGYVFYNVRVAFHKGSELAHVREP